MNTSPKQRDWTPEQRLEQSRKLRERQIWLKSTGPRTPEGKMKSSRNARSARYTERLELKLIKRYLRTQSQFMKLIKLLDKQWDHMTRSGRNALNATLKNLNNELIDINDKLRSGWVCSEAASLNIIPFPAPPP